MGVYVFNTVTLVKELIRDTKEKDSTHDFGKSIIPALVNRGDGVFAYPFRDERGGKPKYWRDIGTLDSYYAANLDLADPYPEIDLYEPSWPIRTYFGQYPPARIVDSSIDLGLQGEVVDSLICAGYGDLGRARVPLGAVAGGARAYRGAGDGVDSAAGRGHRAQGDGASRHRLPARAHSRRGDGGDGSRSGPEAVYRDG